MSAARSSNDRAWLALDVLTIGFPFCAFKVLSGIALWNRAPNGWPLALGLVVLGVIDAVLNAISLGALLADARWSAVCVFQLVATRAKPDATRVELGLSLDALVAFSLVASMVALDGLAALTGPERAIWAWSVVLNVLGAGVGRFARSLLAVRAR